jgi:hypothetical protein
MNLVERRRRRPAIGTPSKDSVPGSIAVWARHLGGSGASLADSVVGRWDRRCSELCPRAVGGRGTSVVARGSMYFVVPAPRPLLSASSSDQVTNLEQMALLQVERAECLNGACRSLRCRAEAWQRAGYHRLRRFRMRHPPPRFSHTDWPHVIINCDGHRHGGAHSLHQQDKSKAASGNCMYPTADSRPAVVHQAAL